MIVYSLLLVTFFICLLSLLVLWRATCLQLPEGWLILLLSISMQVFIYLYGTWVFVSVFAKYLFALCFIITWIVGAIRAKHGKVKRFERLSKWVSLFCLIIFGTLCVLYFTGTTGKPYGYARLALPFKTGKYLVLQGGKGLPTNLFHYKLRGAVYAMDIVKLNKWGNRSNSIFSKRPEDYEIFNDTVYSPCAGHVLKALDENKDNIPPIRKRGPGNTNQVLIDADSMYVFMAHFKYKSVFVKAGDVVSIGQPIGCAGNSGFSLEPHLHIQAHAKTDKTIPWYKEKPLLIEFDGRSYLLFEEIDAGGR